jgi:calcineurin-like phosphoesterase family protein
VTVWFTSDLHLGHVRINELAGRPFASVEEADAELVRRWNERVRGDDTVFVLGDLAMGEFAASMRLAATLRGMKFLVPGNHDRVSSLYAGSERKKAEWAAAYRDAGFVVLREQEWITMPDGRRALLCHFPYTGDSHLEDRYADSRPADEGAWLLHGHTHSSYAAPATWQPRQLHVGVDAWNFCPVPANEVSTLIDACESSRALGGVQLP